MLYPIIVLLTIAGILLCRFIPETRKAFAVILLIAVYVANDIMQLRFEVYERSSFFSKTTLALLFTVFLAVFTIHCFGIPALLKFQLAVTACMLLFCILSVCVWENILNISSDLLLTGMFIFMAPQYPLRSILSVSLSGMELPLLIVLIPLALVIDTSLLLAKFSSRQARQEIADTTV